MLSRTRTARRALALLAAMATTALTIAACGDGDDGASVRTLEITADANGALTVPATAAPGATEITLDNQGKGEAEAQLIRIEGDRSTEEVFSAVGKAISGGPWDDFFFTAGGVGQTPPGESLSVTQELEAGATYYAFNEGAGGQPEPSDLHKIEISGEDGGDLTGTDATVSATEYEFTADGLSSGRNEVTFENAGGQPHHLLVGQLEEGAAIADAKKFLLSDPAGSDGSGPFPPAGSEAATAVLEGGTSQVIELDLKPGKYAFYCFISDRQGGPPHAVKGMISEANVE